MLLVEETCLTNVTKGEREPRNLPWEFYLFVAERTTHRVPSGRLCITVKRWVEVIQANSRRAIRHKVREFVSRRGVRVVSGPLPRAGRTFKK